MGRTLLAAGRWDDARRWASCCGDATAGHDATLAQAAALVAEWRAAEEAMEGATERWDEEGVEGELEEVGEELWESVSQLFVDEAVPAERAGGFLAAAAVVTGRANRSRREQHAAGAAALRWLSGAVRGGGPAWPLEDLEALERRVWLLSVRPSPNDDPDGDGEETDEAVGLLLERGDLEAARAVALGSGRPAPLTVVMAEAAAAVAAGGCRTVGASLPASVVAHLARSGARPAPPATDWRDAMSVEVLEALTAAAPEGAGRAFCERCLVDHLAAQVLGSGYAEVRGKPAGALLAQLLACGVAALPLAARVAAWCAPPLL